MARRVLPAAVPDTGAEVCSEQCEGACCRYIVARIPAPRLKVDHDEIRWFLAHRHIQVNVSARKYYLQVFTPCEHLTAENLCGIYHARYDICKTHEFGECEHFGPLDWEHQLRTPEEYDAFRKRNNRAKKRRAGAASGKPGG